MPSSNHHWLLTLVPSPPQGVDNSYVARLLRLTLLAPDIVEAILMGREPDGLTLEQLYRLPVAWEEQRRELGRC